MDLLNENKYNQKQTPKGKKVVLLLLIISIIAVIAIVSLMIYLEANKVITDTLYIDGVKQETGNDITYNDPEGNRYISLKDLAEKVGYEYYSSEYGKYGTDTTKCYIKNKNLIVGFELDSNQIYKYEENTNLDYQYYTLKYNIAIYNNKLYIAMADLQKALNAYCTIDTNKVISISTMEYLASSYQEQLKETGYSVVTEQNNQKALAYGWIIVTKDGMLSVLDTNFEEIIGSKYKTIYFDEYNTNYIVSNINGRYGIIKASGQIEKSLIYDGLELLNYENMLYKVKNNNMYGIMKKDGTLLTDIVYEDIGYPADPTNKILYTLIIPELNGKSGKTIVVKQNKKYGLIYLENGQTYLPTDHLDKLYSVNDMGQIYYKVEAEKQTVDLLDYLNYRETQQVTLN